MTGLFTALELRFNSSPALKLKGRKLYEGFEGERVNVVKPYSEVNAALVGQIGPFGLDVEEWELSFRFHAKDLKANAANDWITAMTDAFRDSNMYSPHFQSCSCRMMDASVPSLSSGTYDAAVRFRFIAQRRVNLPVVGRT